MSYCPKWWCGAKLQRFVRRTLHMSGIRVGVVTVTCPKCGLNYTDYDAENVPAAPRPDAWQSKKGRLNKALKRNGVKS